MNNKGLTLIELLATMLLICSVTILLISIFNNINNNTTPKTYARKNEINRLQFIKLVEDDLINIGLDWCQMNDTFVNNTLTIPFIDGTKKKISVSENQISYAENQFSLSKPYKYDLNNLKVTISSDDYEQKILKITIPITTSNQIDDIEIVYLGVKKC